MGKFGLDFKTLEERALQLMVENHKSVADSYEILKGEGYDVTPILVRELKKQAFEKMFVETKEEAMASFMLEDIRPIVYKFQVVYDNLEKLYEESSGKPLEQSLIIKQQIKMLDMALRKLGAYVSELSQIKAKNVNIISNSDITLAIKQTQNNIFDSTSPEYKDGKFILTPTPEMLDDFYKWRFKKKKAVESEATATATATES